MTIETLPLRKLHLSLAQHLTRHFKSMSKDTEERTYSISELSKEFDITTRSIRFYEDQGLIKPGRRGQTRVYTKGDRVRLKLVLRGKRLGFSLAETQRLFELYDTDRSSATQLKSMLELVQEKKAILHQQMDDIKVLMMELVTVEKSCIETLASLEHEANTVDGQTSADSKLAKDDQ